jgi:ABC-type nitrate/sulfonate/bicarbonate transport system permease component
MSVVAEDPRKDDAAAPPAGGGSRALRKKRERRRTLLGVLGVVGFFAVWQLLFELGTLNPLFFGSPDGVFRALKPLLIDGVLWPDLRASFNEFALGFGIGAALGIALGILIGWLKWLDDLTEPLLAAFYATPYVAFLPLIIVWLGIGFWSKTVIVIWATFFPMLINVIAGVKNTPPDYIRLARAFCVRRGRLLARVVVPSAVPYVLAGLRQAIGRALVAVIVAEFYLANVGIGFFITEKTNAYEPNYAFAAILLTAVAGIVLVRGVGAIERRVGRRWGLSQS